MVTSFHSPAPVYDWVDNNRSEAGMEAVSSSLLDPKNARKADAH